MQPNKKPPARKARFWPLCRRMRLRNMVWGWSGSGSGSESKSESLFVGVWLSPTRRHFWFSWGILLLFLSPQLAKLSPSNQLGVAVEVAVRATQRALSQTSSTNNTTVPEDPRQRRERQRKPKRHTQKEKIHSQRVWGGTRYFEVEVYKHNESDGVRIGSTRTTIH